MPLGLKTHTISYRLRHTLMKNVLTMKITVNYLMLILNYGFLKSNFSFIISGEKFRNTGLSQDTCSLWWRTGFHGGCLLTSKTFSAYRTLPMGLLSTSSELQVPFGFAHS